MPKKIAIIDAHVAYYFQQLFGPIDPKQFTEVPIKDADYLFYSQSAPDHHAVGPDTIKIFITGENICPDFNTCDYGISSEYLDYGDRHLRVPVYAMYDVAKNLAARPKITADDLAQKQKFCNFIYSNSRFAHPVREQFFHALNKVAPVVSAGRYLRNDTSLADEVSGADWTIPKRNLVQQFRFTIAMENSEQAGYITEKLTDAFLAHTVPIYWGDPRVTAEFDANAFLHLRDYAHHDDAIADILRLDANPERLLALLNAPVFAGGIDRAAGYAAAARDFILGILDQPLITARRRPRHGCIQVMERIRRKDQKGLRRYFKPNRF